MTVSMRMMSAGDGYKYLLKSIAAGDGDRSLSTPLTRYYAEAGNPPGFWLGQGLASRGHGELAGGSQASEAQLQLLIGMGHDPITGEAPGRPYQQFASVAERIEQRVNALDPELGPAARAREVATIEAEEAERGTRRAVADYNFTFSVPKSVSATWAVADAGTQSLIADAHHAVVAELVAFLEREVAATRVGATGPDGAVAHVDVTSRFRPHASVLFSSEALLAAEDRLLDRAADRTGPVVPLATIEKIARKPDPQGRVLGEDQAAALAAIAVSGRVVDVLVGPAGAGKTTAMNVLRRAWEKEHGPGAVVGLAPSAVAAQVLAEDLGIETENTAKRWQNHIMYGTTFTAGQLVIIDEASLAGTMSLDRITREAEKAGAKVLLVGDWAQLQSVDAGAAFAMLVHVGYAITAHRAQGVTTDTSHVVVTTTTTRENFYVSMTRGANSNHAYVCTDRPDDSHSEPHPGDNPDAYGALSAELRQAEANHHDLDALLPRLIAARSFDDADDLASVLHIRVARATSRPAGSGRNRQAPRLIAGLIPEASRPMAEDMRRALDERRELIEQRAAAITAGALAEHDSKAVTEPLTSEHGVRLAPLARVTHSPRRGGSCPGSSR